MIGLIRPIRPIFDRIDPSDQTDQRLEAVWRLLRRSGRGAGNWPFSSWPGLKQ
jgi:hypothetical protein